MAVKPPALPARSVLDGSEHGVTLIQVGIAIRRLPPATLEQALQQPAPTLSGQPLVTFLVRKRAALGNKCLLVKDYERYATTLAGFHVIAFIGYMLKHAAELLKMHNTL